MPNVMRGDFIVIGLYHEVTGIVVHRDEGSATYFAFTRPGYLTKATGGAVRVCNDDPTLCVEIAMKLGMSGEQAVSAAEYGVSQLGLEVLEMCEGYDMSDFGFDPRMPYEDMSLAEKTAFRNYIGH